MGTVAKLRYWCYLMAMANTKVKEERKARKVMLTDSEYEFCQSASTLEHMNGFSSWARKVLLEAASATSRGIRK